MKKTTTESKRPTLAGTLFSQQPGLISPSGTRSNSFTHDRFWQFPQQLTRYNDVVWYSKHAPSVANNPAEHRLYLLAIPSSSAVIA